MTPGPSGVKPGTQGRFPKDLAELLQMEAISLKALVSPYTGQGPTSIAEANDKSYLLYRPGLTATSSPTEIVLAERKTEAGGANFLFVGGHVLWIEDPLASDLIERIQRGEERVRYPE